MNISRALLGAILVSALAAGPARAQSKACDDCCQFPCVEAEIRSATKMQTFYRELATRRGLTQALYEAEEKAKGDELAKDRAKDVGTLAPCKWNMPDPKSDPIAVRPWSAAGWSMTADKDGNVTYNFSLKTNTKTCALRESQIKLLRGITPCSGMADAAEKHERFHVTTCEARKGREETLKEAALDEVAAYDVELKELNALRDVIRKKCKLKSCEDNNVKEAGKRLEKEMEDLKTLVAKRGGK